jgi:hypothetical protein
MKRRRRSSGIHSPYKSPRRVAPARRIPYGSPSPGFTRTTQAYSRSLANLIASSGETKFFDTLINETSITATGSIVPSLNLVAQGTADNQRIGRELKIKGLYIRGQFEQNTSTTVTSAIKMRLIIYLDKQANGAAATMGDILDTTVITTPVNAFRNLDNAKRFKILKDKRVQLNFYGHDGTNAFEHAVNFNYAWTPKKPLSVEFSSTTGGITEIRSNNIGILLVSNTASALAQFDGGARIHFNG